MSHLNRILHVVLICLLTAGLAGCARQPQLTRPAPDGDSATVDVKGECSASLVDGGDVLRISGTCSLIDGTNGIACVLSADGSTLDKRKFTKDSEVLSFDFNVTDQWPSVVYGFISFDTQQCDQQSREVTDLYGKKFQNLAGPNVIWDSKGVIAVFQSDAVEIADDPV